MRRGKMILAMGGSFLGLFLIQNIGVRAAEIPPTSDKAVIITKTLEKKVISKSGDFIIAKCEYEYPHIVNTTKSEKVDGINHKIEEQIKQLYNQNCLEAEKSAREYDQNFPQNGERTSSLLPFEVGSKYTVTFNQSGLLSFYITEYQYLGGAHPNSVRRGYTYDLDKGEAQKASDLMIWTDRQIKQYIASTISKTANKTPDSFFMEEVEKLGQLKFPLQFYLAKEGIVFFFNPYEIAPYVAGVIETSILYEGNENLFRNAQRFSQAIKTLNSEAYLA